MGFAVPRIPLLNMYALERHLGIYLSGKSGFVCSRVVGRGVGVSFDSFPLWCDWRKNTRCYFSMSILRPGSLTSDKNSVFLKTACFLLTTFLLRAHEACAKATQTVLFARLIFPTSPLLFLRCVVHPFALRVRHATTMFEPNFPDLSCHSFIALYSSRPSFRLLMFDVLVCFDVLCCVASFFVIRSLFLFCPGLARKVPV